MNDIKDNGGTAFPVVGHFYGDKLGGQLQHGMTLRDYFAGQALAGLIAQPDGTLCKSTDADGIERERREFAAVMAKAAYRYADAMIAERAK